MVEDALLTTLLCTLAARAGPARVMAWTAPLITLGGALLATAESRWLILAGAVLGTLSPNGQEAGPFAPMEQALLPGTVRSGSGVRAFAWYNVFAFMPSALGAAAAGGVLGLLASHGVSTLAAHRALLWTYAGVGVALTGLYARLAAHQPRQRPADAGSRPALGALGLGPSRSAVLQLAGLQVLDSFGGGFIMQGLVAYWFHLRFGVGPEALGALFFGTSLLSALSFFA